MAVFDDRKTWGLKSDGDIDQTQLNRIEWVYGQEAVIQEIKVTLATIKGEDPFDEEHGLDIFAAIGSQSENLKLYITEAILENHDDDIESINDITVNRTEDRRANVSIDLTLIDGSQRLIPIQL